MLGITKDGSEYTAKCGRAQVVLPVIETIDPESGRMVVEAVSESGIRSLFRTAVDVRYVPVNVKDDTGQVTTTFVPRSHVYTNIEHLLARLANDSFAGQLVRISRMTDSSEACSELARVMGKALSRLCRQPWDGDNLSSYQSYANSYQAVVLDGHLPRIPGRFMAEVDAHRRLDAGRALIAAQLLTDPCATGTGSPGSSYYLSAADGYSPTELCNPLVSEMPSKRRGVVNAVKNAVAIVGEEPSPVAIRDVKRTPPMTNAVVVCMPIPLDDSVIISRSLADRLTARVRKSNWHNIDGVVNCRGGFRPTGRNGRPVKRGAEWPITLERTESVDGTVSYVPRQSSNHRAVTYPNRDADLLHTLRLEYESHWKGLVEKLGPYTASECREWKAWLSHRPEWTRRNECRPGYRKYGCGVEMAVVNGAVMYREDLGVSYSPPEVGMKVQSDGDLFKGVVSAILADEKMPLVRLAGKLAPADVVCEMNESAARHGSLRFAHGQMALYALAHYVGGLGMVGHPSIEEIAELAVECGVYETDELTCEVFDSTGEVSYGYLPAGMVRVCRHRQDPSTVSTVKGDSTDREWVESNSVRSGGCVNGIPDTFCMLAAGLTECARELRHEIASGVMLKLELLRNATA